MRPTLGTLPPESECFVRSRRLALRYLLGEVPFVGLESVPRIQLVIARRIRDGGEIRYTEIDPDSFVTGRLSLNLMVADDVKLPFAVAPDCFHLTDILNSHVRSRFDRPCLITRLRRVRSPE